MNYTKGALPEKWKLINGVLIDEDGYGRYVCQDNGRLDRGRIALILENYGYLDCSRLWYMSSASLDLLKTMKEINNLAESDARYNPQFAYIAEISRNAIAKAEGRSEE